MTESHLRARLFALLLEDRSGRRTAHACEMTKELTGGVLFKLSDLLVSGRPDRSEIVRAIVEELPSIR